MRQSIAAEKKKFVTDVARHQVALCGMWSGGSAGRPTDLAPWGLPFHLDALPATEP